jgi:hypothetical protein
VGLVWGSIAVDSFCNSERCDPIEMVGVSFMLWLSHTSAFSWRPAFDDFDVVAFAMGFDGETQTCDAAARDQDGYSRVECLLHCRYGSVLRGCVAVLEIFRWDLFILWMLVLYLANYDQTHDITHPAHHLMLSRFPCVRYPFRTDNGSGSLAPTRDVDVSC